MNLAGLLTAAAGAWIAASAVVAVPIGKAMSKADRQTDPEFEVVNWLPFLPPVPPSRSELAWLRDQPGEVLVGQDLRWRFDDVVSGGFR